MDGEAAADSAGIPPPRTRGLPALWVGPSVPQPSGHVPPGTSPLLLRSRPSLPAPRQGHGSRSARLRGGGGDSRARRIPACPLLSRVLLSGPFHLSRRQFHACKVPPALRMPCPCWAVPTGPWSAGFRGHPQRQTPRSRLPNPRGARGPWRDTALTMPRACPTQIQLPCGPRGLLCTRA